MAKVKVKVKRRSVEEYALELPCPSCLVEPGEECVIRRRRSPHRFHLTRMDAGNHAKFRTEQ